MEREFTPTQHAVLRDNFTRIVSEVSAKTQNNYFKKFNNIIKRITKQPKKDANSINTRFIAEIEAIEAKRAEGLLKQASVRQYKASILYGLTLVYEYLKSPDNMPLDMPAEQLSVLSRLAQDLSASDINSLYKRVSDWRSEDAKTAKMLDNQAHLQSNTSARKAKLLDADLLEAILKINEPRLNLLKLFLQVNVKIGLRPNEWYACRLIDSDSFAAACSGDNSKLTDDEIKCVDKPLDAYSVLCVKQSLGFLELPYPDLMSGTDANIHNRKILAVKNSKNSHGRANGGYRYIILDQMSDKDMSMLECLIDDLHIKHQDMMGSRLACNESNFDTMVMQPLQSQFKYILDTDSVCGQLITKAYNKKKAAYDNEHRRALKLGKAWSRQSPIKMYPTLYSTRHQAVSNAKSAFMNPVSMAALFGHASVITAERHYGRLTDGWGSNMVAPHQMSIDQVVIGLTESQLVDVLSDMPGQALRGVYEQHVDNVSSAPNNNPSEADDWSALAAMASNNQSVHVKLNNAILTIALKSTSGSQVKAVNKQAAAQRPAARKHK